VLRLVAQAAKGAIGMDREIRILSLAALASAILVPALAAAQTPPHTRSQLAPQTEQRDPDACAQGEATVGSGGDLDTGKEEAGSLSDKLARSNGVICPPSQVDPDIRKPAPESGGAMPVIPPPGSPGGNPSVQPK